MSEMFCFQCQQTAGNSGCVRTGVCGKQPKTANLQDYLVCSLIHLAEIYAAKEDYPPEVTHLLADGLFATLTNVNFDDAALQGYIRRAEKLTPQRLPIQDPSWLWRGDTDIVSLRATLLFGMNVLVVLTFAFLFKKYDSCMYTMIEMFISSKVVNLVLYGPGVSEVC